MRPAANESQKGLAIPTNLARTDSTELNDELETLRNTLACLGDAVIASDASGNVTLLNAVARSLTGWTQKEAHGEPLATVFTIVNEKTREPVECPASRALREGVAVTRANHTLLLAKDGTERAIDDSAAPIRNAVGDVAGVVLVFRDVTERRRSEEKVRLQEAGWRNSEIRYRRLFESARDGILILDATTGKIIDANPFMSDLLGYERSYFLGKELWEIGVFGDIAANQAAFRELQDKGYIRYEHLPLATRDKKRADVEFVSNTYESDGQMVIQCNIRDCSERFRLEQAVQKSLEEKAVLLKEVHHRVKNNLQVISSMLHLQSLHSHDQSSAEMFRDCRDRVRSMALVHARLYRSQDLAQVDFADYVERLATDLFNSHQVDSGRIKLAVDVEGVNLPIDAAIPCGLLLNELISNCLKHAFLGRDQGCIRIELRSTDDGSIALSVSDNGVGLPPRIEPLAGETFGMQLIADLVLQLHGKVQVDRDGGTAIRIVFPAGDARQAQRITHAR
jgi:PAS domain S-box-containing protein